METPKSNRRLANGAAESSDTTDQHSRQNSLHEGFRGDSK